MASGNISLYLDTFHNGIREYEYLHLYLVPVKTRADKEKNRETLRLAEVVRAKRMIEYNSGKFGVEKATDVRFYDYFNQIASTRKTESRRSCFQNVLNYVKRYEPKNIMLKDIDARWVSGVFAEFSHLAHNTQAIYQRVIKTVLLQALDDGHIFVNPMRGIKLLQLETNERQFLTFDEVKLLYNSPHDTDLRRAFLFSCLTGLRCCDVMSLRWGDVSQNGEYTRLTFRQQKTQKQEYLDISPSAVGIMGERRASGDLVFPETAQKSICVMRKDIPEWVRSCGIDKYITFHCSRHTFAMLMISLNTDIYTISKLLGHSKIETTQIYAKIADKQKQQAVSAIPHLL